MFNKKHEDELDKCVDYINDIYENKIELNDKNYNKIINELKNIKMYYKPNGYMSLYIDYLFDSIKSPKFNNKVRKIKLQKLINYNVTTN